MTKNVSNKDSKINHAKPHYHHGDLRVAIIKQALVSIKEQGVQNLSIRNLAREIGVSHTAPYRHFIDKQALLAAIAEDGYKILLESMRQALDSSEHLATRIEEVSCAYVNFTLAYPVHSQLMFGNELANRKNYPSLQESADRVFATAHDILQAGQKNHLVAHGSAELITATMWSWVHGLANLLGTNRMQLDYCKDHNTDELTRQSVRLLFSGILKNFDKK
jgi:AcrR family transcriptional regulator